MTDTIDILLLYLQWVKDNAWSFEEDFELQLGEELVASLTEKFVPTLPPTAQQNFQAELDNVTAVITERRQELALVASNGHP